MSTVSVPVERTDQAGEARRSAAEMAKTLGFDEADVARAALVTTELATNLWKHGGGGEVLISDGDFGAEPCIEIIALDRGRGMVDVARCFQDGYSTSGTAGGGLGAVGRLSQCDIFSQRDKGTAILARIFRRGARIQTGRFGTGGVAVPMQGEQVCGDGFVVRQSGSQLLAMMADGLGHGPDAAKCARRAIEAFQTNPEWEPARVLAGIHGALRGSRGAAVSVAWLDLETRRIIFSGIGNVLGLATSPNAPVKNFVVMPGIAGENIRSVREFTYEWPAGAVVLIYSDGITSHWSLDEYPGVSSHDPSLIAAVIYRDRKRGRDDASVLAIRESNLP
jgi:anti-sigma regulatory factor (Ser/Thr protein kinase)